MTISSEAVSNRSISDMLTVGKFIKRFINDRWSDLEKPKNKHTSLTEFISNDDNDNDDDYKNDDDGDDDAGIY